MRASIRWRLLAAVALLCVGAGVAVSILAVPPNVADAAVRSTAPPPAVLHVRGMVIDRRKPPRLTASLTATADTGYAIVQYDPAFARDVYDAITRTGGKHLGPIARHGLFVSGISLKELRAIPGVVYADTYHPEYKLEPALRTQLAANAASTKTVTLALRVFHDAPGTAKAIAPFGRTRVVPVGVAGEKGLVATIALKDLPRVASIVDVRDVERAMIPKPLLDNSPVLTHIRSNGSPPWANIDGLTGANQMLGIYDTGCDNGNINTIITDVRGRIAGDVVPWTNPWDLGANIGSFADVDYQGTPSAHGTFVADIAIGNGSSSVNGLLTGIAFGARTIFRPFNADSNGLQPGFLALDVALAHARTAGAFVHNDSWDPATGTYPDIEGIDNEYTAQGSEVIDDFVTATDARMLIVTSAGNSGPNADTMGTLSCSKNALSVGNSGNGAPPTGAKPDAGATYAAATAPNALRTFSSRGPTPAGQLKPDVVAPGAMIAARCPQSNCPDKPYFNQPNFAYNSGTSFSAPVVAGEALLLRELLRTQTGNNNSTGMLIKALIMNGASQIFNYVPNVPDDGQGWGRVNLDQSVNGFGGGDVYYYDSLNEGGGSFRFTQTGQSVVFQNVYFTSANVPLAIMLVWYDPPGALADGSLVNDLDLTLTLADGSTVYHGGVPSMYHGLSQAGGGADDINTAEKIVLAATPQGACTITVTATTIAINERQGFALAVSSVDHQGQQSTLHLLKRKH